MTHALSILLLVFPAQAPPDGFDLNKPKETAEWLRPAVLEVMSADPSNALKQKAARDKLAAKLKGLEGRQIEWVTPISSVTPRGVTIASSFMTYPFDVYQKVKNGELKDPPADLYPVFRLSIEKPPIPFDDARWAATLKEGDKVKIVGRIAAVKHQVNVGKEGGIHITLKIDGKAVKP